MTIDRTPASALDAMIDGFAERWSKVSTQEQADQVASEMSRAIETFATEEILAYAVRPAFRDLLVEAMGPAFRDPLLAVCVIGRARERFGMRPHAAIGDDAG